MRVISVLPTGLKNAIQKKAKDKRQIDRLTELSCYIFSKYFYEQISFKEHIEISKNHFFNTIGCDYLKDLTTLKRAGIIKSSEFYHYSEDPDKKGQCKSYRFKPALVYTSPELVEFETSIKKRFDNDFVTKKTVYLLSKLRLSVDRRKLPAYVKNLVSDEYILRRCRINEEIPDDFYQYVFREKHKKGYKYKKSKTKRSKAFLLDVARRNGFDLILYRGRCFIERKSDFVKDKKTEIKAAYLFNLVKFKDIRKRANINCSRNTTNYRLDTNLTNLKSDLIELIRLDGEKLVSIDLKNSQFTILAHTVGKISNIKDFFNIYFEKFCRKLHMLRNNNKKDIQTTNKTQSPPYVTTFGQFFDKKSDLTHSLSSDLVRFKKLTQNGLFYENFASCLTADSKTKITREEAKRMMFLTAFSSHRYNPRSKQVLKKHYPGLVSFMDNFKREAIKKYKEIKKTDPERFKVICKHRNKKTPTALGNAELAVFLQTIESTIFVDGILKKLLRLGFRVFSKHDSILCKESDFKAVYKIVEEELIKVLGKDSFVLKSD